MNLASKLIVAVLAGGTAGHTIAASPSHCSRDEQVVFSCLVGQKMASVCLAPSSALQYRFGKPGSPRELIYPVVPEAANSGFRFMAESRSAKGSITNLQFTRSGTTYTIFRFTHSFEGNYAGIAFATEGVPHVRLACTESTVTDSLSRLETAHLPPLTPAALVE